MRPPGANQCGTRAHLPLLPRDLKRSTHRFREVPLSVFAPDKHPIDYAAMNIDAVLRLSFVGDHEPL